MSHSDQLQELLQRVAALEAREKALTAASNAYQAIITTMLGNMEKTERDRIIAMIDQAHEIAYAAPFSAATNRKSRKSSRPTMWPSACSCLRKARPLSRAEAEL